MTIIEEIKNEVRAARQPTAGLTEQLDRDAAPRAAQVTEVSKHIQADCARKVSALEAQITEAKAQAEREVASMRDAASEAHERIEAQILDEFHRDVAPPIKAFDDAPTTSTRAIIDLVAVTGARVRRELGVEFDAPRHLAFAVCAEHVAREPHAVNALAEQAWELGVIATQTLQGIARCALDAFGDETAARDALRRLKELVANHARTARSDLIGERAVLFFAARRLGADAAAHRRWLDLVETKHREQAHRQSVAAAEKYQADIRRARSGDLGAAEGKGPGWFEHVRSLGRELFGPVLPVQPRGGAAEPLDELAKSIGLGQLPEGDRERLTAARNSGGEIGP